MWKEPLSNDREAILQRIVHLKSIGCEILRFAVPDIESAELLGQLSSESTMPLVADIHFDHRLALRCLDYPVGKIRINPGNIGSSRKVREVFLKAADKGVPVRIGVNAGSLPKDLERLPDRAEAMVQTAERELETISGINFPGVIISLKSSDINTTVRANEIFASRFDFPLHLGITEAGPVIPGIVKHSIAFAELFGKGIGDTIRVSLSGSMEEEIQAGREILKSTGIRTGGITVVSCPRCGRKGFDVTGFLEGLGDLFQRTEKPLTVAVMGCEVNGPGEAKEADIGITGSGSSVVIFRKGTVIKKTDPANAREEFIKAFEELL
jgi:(E)-4-hydroxy-3-methylbut-2-enyl-diphosphate synthase